MKALVLVSGFAGHGKDTFADLFAQAWGADKVHRCAFAGPVKTVAMALVGMPREIAYGNQAARAAWTAYRRDARTWLQIVGTEVGRTMADPNVWLDRLADEIVALHESGSEKEVAAVSDTRFLNERDDFPAILQRRIPGLVVKRAMIFRPQVKTLGVPPTLRNHVVAFLTGLPVVRHLRRAVGSGEPVKLMHPSESGVWEMQRLIHAGDKTFDRFVVNSKDNTDDLRAEADGLAAEIRRQILTSGT